VLGDTEKYRFLSPVMARLTKEIFFVLMIEQINTFSSTPACNHHSEFV
jgi:hypothetical protein